MKIRELLENSDDARNQLMDYIVAMKSSSTQEVKVSQITLSLKRRGYDVDDQFVEDNLKDVEDISVSGGIIRVGDADQPDENSEEEKEKKHIRHKANRALKHKDKKKKDLLKKSKNLLKKK